MNLAFCFRGALRASSFPVINILSVIEHPLETGEVDAPFFLFGESLQTDNDPDLK